MTDKAFSDLTSASALNDADIFAITQSGTSKKIASSVVKTYMQEGFTPTSTTTLTNKTVNLTNNTLTGTIAQFNSALSDADFCTIAGSETITNKTLTTPILSATVSGTTSGRLGYLSGALSYGDGTNQQTVATLDRTQTFTAAQSFSGNVTLGDASGDTVTLNSGTVTLNNSTTISAASTRTLTLNGGAGSNGLVIDASNNVGIGTSSISTGRAAIWGDGNGVATTSTNSNSQLHIVTTNAAVGANNAARITFNIGNGNSASAKIEALRDGQDTFQIINNFSGPLVLGTNGTGKATLDASGNLGLGVTPTDRMSILTTQGDNTFSNSLMTYGSGTAWPAGFANIYDANYVDQFLLLNSRMTGGTRASPTFTSQVAGIVLKVNGQTGGLAFLTIPAGSGQVGTQAMTLDASGRLIVGNTSQLYGFSGRLYTEASSSTYLPFVAVSSYSGDLGNPAGSFYKYDNNSTTSQVFVRFAINNGQAGCGQINANGAAAAAFGAFSDSRLKENITALPNQLANICALKPSEFDYKDGSGHQIGFIAQEMQEVYPDVVGEGKDGMLTITGWSKTEARLVKAIQELAAQLNELKQRIK